MQWVEVRGFGRMRGGVDVGREGEGVIYELGF